MSAATLRDNIQHAASMVSKSEAHYGKGTKQAHCAICTHYQHGYICDKVSGRIFPGGWCRYFEARK